MIEVWKNIEGFEGYQISNYGHVSSCRPLNGIGGLKDSYRTLKLPITSKGYYRIGLSRNGKQIKMFVHRLVLEAFVGPCPDGMEARHLDGDSKNNHVTNLKWGTPVENRHDRVRHGTHNRGEKHGMAILIVSQVKEIKTYLEEGKLCERKIGEMFNVSRDVVSKIKQGKNWGWIN